jgi:hypothetical protein
LDQHLFQMKHSSRCNDRSSVGAVELFLVNLNDNGISERLVSGGWCLFWILWSFVFFIFLFLIIGYHVEKNSAFFVCTGEGEHRLVEVFYLSGRQTWGTLNISLHDYKSSLYSISFVDSTYIERNWHFVDLGKLRNIFWQGSVSWFCQINLSNPVVSHTKMCVSCRW